MADWSVVGRFTDPAPGDPVALRALAQHLGSSANQIAALVTRLGRLASRSDDLGMVGTYAPGYRQMLAGLPPELSRVDRAFRRCGAALDRYASCVEEAKALSRRALGSGSDAQQRWQSAGAQIRTMLPPTHAVSMTPVGLTPTAVDTATHGLDESLRQAIRHSAAQARTARHDQDAARRLAAQASEIHNAGQARAVREIDQAAEGVHNDSLWDKVFRAVAGAAQLVDRILRKVLRVVVVVLAVVVAAYVVARLTPLLLVFATQMVARLGWSLMGAVTLSALTHRSLIDSMTLTTLPLLNLLPLSRWVAPLGSAADLRAPQPMSPTAANTMWRGLTPQQQQQMVRDSPEFVGGQDGLPVWARDAANRTLLAREKARVSAELKAAKQRLAQDPTDGLLNNNDAKAEVLRARLDSIMAIENTLLRDEGNIESARTLIELDFSRERVEAAVGIGDVENADHVAVFSPGLTATVDGSLLGYDVDVSNVLAVARSQSAQNHPPQTVAGVTWIGYQAPQLTPYDVLVSPSAVTQDTAARAGGDQLATLTQGLTISRDTDPHLTVLAHSYGSTTAGFAAQHPNTGIDDLVLFGSPGPGVSDASDLQVGSGKVYAMEAGSDPVANLGRFGGDPSWMHGITPLSADASPAGSAASGHTEYMNQGTTSQYNMAAVMSGHPEMAVRGRGADFMDFATKPLGL